MESNIAGANEKVVTADEDAVNSNPGLNGDGKVDRSLPHSKCVSDNVVMKEDAHIHKAESIKQESCDDDDGSVVNATDDFSTEDETSALSDVKDESETDAAQVTSYKQQPEVPKRKRQRGVIYDENLDADSLVQKRKKRSVELKLKNLKWTLNQPCEVTGKRQKKAPDRFELALLSKRKTSMDDAEGDGDSLGSIPWIVQHVRDANLYTLRLLHRVIFRKQGMFSEKHIRRSVMTFRGFPFDLSSSEVEKRKMPMEKASAPALAKLCDLLGLRSGEKNEMIKSILKFLHRPSRQQVEAFLQDAASMSLQQREMTDPFKMPMQAVHYPGMIAHNMNMEEDGDSSPDHAPHFIYPIDNNLLNSPWIKPSFFTEGRGTKLKCFKPIVANIQVATHSFIEMLHRLLFLYVDGNTNLRRNILEFNGFASPVGSTEFIFRNKLLFGFPLEQIKLVCRVLCLPTWHRSRQYLIDGIMNFLASPCLSAMKKTVPPPASAGLAITNSSSMDMTDKDYVHMKVETEEIEIVPDIHIPDDDFLIQGKDPSSSNSSDESVVKLRNFPRIHYQVVSTPASKLNDLHLILYGRPCPLNNVRKNILEFTSFPFAPNSSEYQSRKTILEQMGLDSLITIVTVLSLTSYVVDLSRVNIIQAVLKFLLKPSALLGGDQQPSPLRTSEPIKNVSLNVLMEEKNRMNLNRLGKTGEITIQPINPSQAPVKCPQPTKPKDGANKRKSQPPVKVVTKSPSLPMAIKKEKVDTGYADLDEPLAKVQKSTHSVSFHDTLESDECDDEPLSKFIGHPSDDQLKALITKIVKESTLDAITMKQVIKIVFNTYPNYDLTYRKEFIKSVVRQILSQMDESRCTVSTTVLTF